MAQFLTSLIPGDLFRQEWFWAIVAIVISILVFTWEQRSANKIARGGFIYNISNDFANNERILKVYQWIEDCRRQNHNVQNYRQLSFSTDTSIFQSEEEGSVALDFIDIDTYINHFESVYVILENVHIDSIDELFQQRFFTFMMNPYIQKEELFECFSSDVNDFRLCKKWIHSIYRRKHYKPEALADYLRTYTCGEFELCKPIRWETGLLRRLRQHRQISRYLENYIYYICDPRCRYGYYAFKNRNADRKVMRIIQSVPSDLEQLVQLQNRVVAALPEKELYCPSIAEELKQMLEQTDKYRCVQVVDGQQIVGFACMIYDPLEKWDLYRDLPEQSVPEEQRCIFETVFVSPDYRGYGIQQVLAQVLCDWARQEGKHSVCATVHPENSVSRENLEAVGFACVTDTPLEKYGSRRNYFLCDLTRKQKKTDDYTIYPYV